MIGYIYKIWDNDDPTLVYYGSTKQRVSGRIANHRNKSSGCKSKIIIERNNYQYATLEKVEYEEKFELKNRERFWIENNICVNKNIPNRTQKEYNIINNQRAKEWYKLNKKNVADNHKQIVKCPHCSKELTKNNLLRHINHNCKIYNRITSSNPI